jgi:hypothetical protein
MTSRLIAVFVGIVSLAFSPIARADPIHMVCSGKTLLTNRTVDTNTVLSLTVDLRTEMVTVGEYQPVAILPAIPGPPTFPGLRDNGNVVRFRGPTINGVLRGTVDRITGEANITFQLNTPQERFFRGICRTAEKLF